MDIPLLGLGTYNLTGKECTNVVIDALSMGYQHIDTASAYDNHKAIGKALKNFDRSKLFITSKFKLEELPSVEKACHKALKELGTDYLDLYLIHWPLPDIHLPTVFKEMQAVVSSGKVRYIGVSNFTIHHLEDLAEENLHPAANQVEFHPYLYQKNLLDYCREHHIKLIAYRPFGKGELLKDDLLLQIASKYDCTAAQLILSWLFAHKIPAIPKASSSQHLQDNLLALDLNLSIEDVNTLNTLHQNRRFCKPDNPIFEY